MEIDQVFRQGTKLPQGKVRCVVLPRFPLTVTRHCCPSIEGAVLRVSRATERAAMVSSSRYNFHSCLDGSTSRSGSTPALTVPMFLGDQYKTLFAVCLDRPVHCAFVLPRVGSAVRKELRGTVADW